MPAKEIILYSVFFISTYVQIFFLVTFFEKRHKLRFGKGVKEWKVYPTVTIVVPCWNEENTLEATVDSLLALDYPKDKISFFLVDDGSTDGTLLRMKRYENNPQVKVFHKENGGKHTALNLGIKKSKSDFVGCLDADSFVHPLALKRIMTYFSDPKTMAVSPSVVVHKPSKVIERAQKADYNMAAFIKKMFASVNGLHVASGAFTIFRREVFRKVGLYKNAYNTEDFEITLRMHAHQFKIDQCNDAFVFTVAPNSFNKLFKQRLRWMYGFIKNVTDYRFLLFKKKFGTIGFLTLPAAILSIFGVVYIFFNLVISLARFIVERVQFVAQNGWAVHWSLFHFDPFFINVRSTVFIALILYSLVITSILIGMKMSGEKPKFSMDIFYFIFIYMIMSPLWLMKAFYKVLLGQKISWR